MCEADPGAQQVGSLQRVASSPRLVCSLICYATCGNQTPCFYHALDSALPDRLCHMLECSISWQTDLPLGLAVLHLP